MTDLRICLTDAIKHSSLAGDARVNVTNENNMAIRLRRSSMRIHESLTKLLLLAGIQF